MALKQLSSGAEAIIFRDGEKIVKDRIPKSYRIPEIDAALRNFRTRREAKVIERLNKIGLNVPRMISSQDNKIEMEYIDGPQIKRLLDKDPSLAKSVGIALAKMHDNEIIHGDLTTSNMIMKGDNGDKNNTLYFIDFGLSFFSKRIEDKAVDIHLFKQALESKHYSVFDKAYKHFLDGYRPKDRSDVLKRLGEVEARGRYKEKI
jgi:Kae1-associated kinase Bud32